MTFELSYATALMLGSLHAFEADHLAAVTSFAVRKPEPRAAMRFGLQWSLGHGTSILVAGALLIFLGLQIPVNATATMERVVGAALVLVGLWTIRTTRTLHAHEHSHDGLTHVHLHSHAHPNEARHEHKHAPALMGLLHGLAGAAPAVALVPLALFDTAAGGLSYLLLFAVGTAASMSAFALCVGHFTSRASRFAEKAGRVVGQFAGIGTITIGIIWLIR